MHVVFGMAADGGAHPAHPGTGSGAVGGAVVGPAGLLDLLAGQLGLSGPPVAPVVRIAAWQAKLEAAAAVGPRFYSASLVADALSTARLLLSWRDDLTEAGWVPVDTGTAGPRLADLAAAELTPPPLPRCRSDLLREVISRLAGGARSELATFETIEDLDLLPPPWQALARALSDSGVAVSRRPSTTPTAGDGDLARLQRFLGGGGIGSLVGDGSLTLLESRTAIMAAEAVADWVAHDPGRGRGTVFVVPSGDTGLLDGAFARRGLPALGASPRSTHRGALQLLPLAFSVAWAPLDPQKLLELLLLPTPPIDRWAARLLAGALSREPGVGGPAWADAWSAIEAGVAERDGGAAGKAILAEWRAWMEVGAHGRSSGMPAAAAAAISDRVRRWALATDGGARDPLLLCAVGAADALSGAFGALGRSPVTATQVEGLIDIAVAEGLPDPAHVAEEGGARVVTRPGAVWGEAARIVWWGFSGTEGQTRQPWTEAETAALAGAGCEVETAARMRRRAAAHWEQPVLAARGALVLVTPSLDRGAEVTSHPLAHRMAPMLRGPSRAAISADAEALLADARVRLAGREVIRRAHSKVDLPAARATWALPASLADAVQGRAETASSIQDLLECQFRWVLRHVARLRAGRAHAIPARDRLIGNVAHALAEAVLPVGRVPDPDEVRRAAVAGLDAVVDAIAAPLRLSGSSGELAFARARIPDSLATLAALLADRGMAVVGMEVERASAAGAPPIRSRIDLLVRDRQGGEAVIDLKWTSSRTWRRTELEEGRAIQLATYGHLVAPAGGAPAGYYLLRQRELLAEAGSALAREGLRVARTLDATWEAMETDWGKLTRLARSGRGLATGVPGVAEHLPADLGFPPGERVCAFCDMGHVCRVRAGG
ncbi:PD-(D/E)XK nuclease family protein [Lichenibacterium ramalinae]|uniref:PD-(D/E)XK endonuclease-like domain-containing protein n=1 Tax=Lichenibacterium ramalinae TaxID=2316527 RepID=A0A4Q2RCK0_9HYPH|nr:PD-(D/E)XK nuclease family protein [Lichenibacterium ramalinae]RYB04317.1 hypothetical protein D3272_12710 [Lichenibacterium ramalinae]